MHIAGMQNLPDLDDVAPERRTSSTFSTTGFSTSTCLPAPRAQIAEVHVVSVCVQMLTQIDISGRSVS